MTINQQIIAHVKSQDQKGLVLLYDHYGDSLYGIAVRMLMDDSYAEDALQRTFLKIWNHIEKYDESKSTLYTWMARILKNTCLDIQKLASFKKQRKTDSLESAVYTSMAEKLNTDSLDTNSLLAELEDKYAFVLEYLYLKGYSQGQLAKEFDIPLGTIKTRTKKALNQLRELLKDEKDLFVGSLLVIIFLSLILQLCR